MIESSKRGQSLVEVVVALAIVTIVFSSTVTLIIGVYNLAMSSRNSTEAIAIAQMVMTDAINESREKCTRKKITKIGAPFDGVYATYYVDVETEGAKLAPIVDGTQEIITDSNFNTANFAKFTVTMKWNFRNKDYDYEISQIVQK
jgi:Tfp pilus assembly protein PilV